MSDTASLLENVRIAKPCTADWNAMQGDDRVRHCGQCDLDVYDLSAMRRTEAESFLAERLGKGRTCVRFHRRADGRLLTRDCPVGVRAAWRRVAWAASALAAAGFAAAAMFAPQSRDGSGSRASGFRARLHRLFGSPPATPPAPRHAVMGDVAEPPPPPTDTPRALMGEMHVGGVAPPAPQPAPPPDPEPSDDVEMGRL